MKPFSQASDNNKQPILKVLKQQFSDVSHVLEVGSGTGQHAVFFAENMPHLQWKTSDLVENHQGIQQWLADSDATNLDPPLVLYASLRPWPITDIDAIFTANTLHIMSWANVVSLFDAFARYLVSGAVVCIYGPFNYGGAFTSASNAQFDVWLKQQNSYSGLRDFEKINTLAEEADLLLCDDVEMPANNRLLVFKKV